MKEHDWDINEHGHMVCHYPYTDNSELVISEDAYDYAFTNGPADPKDDQGDISLIIYSMNECLTEYAIDVIDNAIEEENSTFIHSWTHRGMVIIKFTDRINIHNVDEAIEDDFIKQLTVFIETLQRDYCSLFIDRDATHAAILSNNGIDALKDYLKNIAEEIFIDEDVKSGLDDIPEDGYYKECMAEPIGNLLEYRDGYIIEYNMKYDIDKRLREAYENKEFTKDEMDKYIILMLS